ncbi:MAG: MFS transporter [Elusimicrobiaceae bacterium]|nr:MFS transporter [Elusimicrobiaceae bacterium]MBR2505221.1 MFS transporter [Elusimicrobiaceae bacterium]MBR5609632.1 MFS transporter [Elusimicrobiaceae bacterium]
MTEKKESSLVAKLVPVMLAFFAMGFVDSVGTATNYVKESFGLSNTVANLCPSMVFFWFLVCSVPTGMLMNKIGRRKTVLISLGVTIAALVLPLLSYNFATMMIAFALLGIGNALMQVSLNPLVSNIVSGDKLASFMTFGQFVKAIASFIAPILAAWFAAKYQNWALMYGLFAIEGVIAFILLAKEDIKEEEITGKPSTFTECLALLGNGTILLCFVGIMCHVGIDVGTNTAAPQILMDRLGWPLEKAIYATSIYFMFRTIGCFSGSFLLAKLPAKVVFGVSVFFMLAAMGGLFVFQSQWPLYVCIALIGLGNSNIFPIIFSQALLQLPEKKNEVSGLMIMGLVGGTVFPLLMGFASDAMGSQVGSVAVMTVAVVYLLFLVAKIKKIA